jgi:hypothetical protein
MTRFRFPRPAAWLALSALLAGVAVLPRATAPAADHRDGPIFVSTAANGQQDLNDIYVFRSPANANNTVFVFTQQPFPGVLTPPTYDPGTIFDIKIDTTGDAVEDLTLRTTFGPPDANGVQDVTMRALPSTKFPPTGIVARGKTGTNIPVTGGGMFRAAVQDDPFFFDAGAFSTFASTGAGFPRPAGQAHNFFGPNGNTLAIVLEIPSVRIAPNNTIIGVFITSTKNNVQLDRMGRPAINTALIPPVPRNSLARGERRNAFNAGLPRNDVRDFRADMKSILTGVYGETSGTADIVTSLLLPDLLKFQIGNPNGFGTVLPGTILGNGRRLSDDVIDTELFVITDPDFPAALGGGPLPPTITTDNVGDDNGLKVTDGSVDPVSGQTRAIAFPYIGAANQPLNGPGTGPNP